MVQAELEPAFSVGDLTVDFVTLRPDILLHRLVQYRFQRTYPDAPWITQGAVYALATWLRPTDMAFEWGSGRSTLWLARRVRHLVSIEHDPGWHSKVRDMLQGEKLETKVEALQIPCNLRNESIPISHPYPEAIQSVSDASLDLVLVDGKLRLSCLLLALPKLRPGGLLVLDNAQRYLPNHFLGKPTSLKWGRTAPLSPDWDRVVSLLASWRQIHTSDGINDTLLCLKAG